MATLLPSPPTAGADQSCFNLTLPAIALVLRGKTRDKPRDMDAVSSPPPPHGWGTPAALRPVFEGDEIVRLYDQEDATGMSPRARILALLGDERWAFVAPVRLVPAAQTTAQDAGQVCLVIAVQPNALSEERAGRIAEQALSILLRYEQLNLPSPQTSTRKDGNEGKDEKIDDSSHAAPRPATTARPSMSPKLSQSSWQLRRLSRFLSRIHISTGKKPPT